MLDWEDFNEKTAIPVTLDPGNRRIVYDELPTISVRGNARNVAAVTTADVASKLFGSGSVGRITRLHLYSAAAAEFLIKDQIGTLDHIALDAGEDYRLQGAPKEPLYVARSNFTIKNIGSLAAGTVLASFEGFSRNAEVGFAHRGSR